MSLAEAVAQADGLESLLIFAGIAIIVLVVDRLFLRLALEEKTEG